VHQGNNPGDAHRLAREWTALGDEMKESAQALEKRVRGTESGWRGEAGDAARQAISDLVAWAEAAAETSSQMADRIADQAQIAERAKVTMPEPVHFNTAQELANAATTGGTFGLVAISAGLKQKSDQAQSAHDQAVHVMQAMESDSRHVDANTPRFTPPPEVVNGSQRTGLQPSMPASGGLPTREKPGVAPQVAGTISAGASPAAVAPVSQAPSPAPGHEAWNGGAGAVSGGIPVGSPQSPAAAAPGGGARGGAPRDGAAGAAGGGSAGGGLPESAAHTVKTRPVGSPPDGSAAAPTSQASSTQPPGVHSSQSNPPNSSSGSAPRAADGHVQAHGPSQGPPPRQFGAGARRGGSSHSSGSSSGRGRSGPASQNPGASSQRRDPNHRTHKPASADKNNFPPQAGRSGRPGSTAAAGADSIDGAGVAPIPGGGFSSMSGQLPPIGSEVMPPSGVGAAPPGGAAGKSPDPNHVPLVGGAQGTSSASAPAAQTQGGPAMQPMGAGAGHQGTQEKQRKSPGYLKGEKIVEEPEHVAPTVLGAKFKKKQRPHRD
jgi:hypothetical protein